LPARVTGLTRTVRHATECEDTAHALLEWEGGAVGYFASATTEPETGRRLELVCDRAKVTVAGDVLHRLDIAPGLREHAATDPEPFGRPRLTERAPEVLASGATHAPVYADLVAAVREGRAPRCDGAGGRASLELANAISARAAGRRSSSPTRSPCRRGRAGPSSSPSTGRPTTRRWRSAGARSPEGRGAQGPGGLTDMARRGAVARRDVARPARAGRRSGRACGLRSALP